MTIAWSQVEAKPEFQSLSPKEKAEAQEQYFNEVVAPKAGDDAEEAKKQFFTQYNYSEQEPVTTGKGEQPTQDQPEQEPAMLESAKDLITGDSKMTPEMKSMGEIGNAPELNEMSWASFKTSLGLLATGDTEKSKAVIKSQIPEAEFTEDSKGNIIVNLPSGQYALNKPGVSGQDIAKGVFDMLSFTPAGRAVSIPAAVAKSAGTELALQGITKGVGGGDVDAEDVLVSGALGGAGKLAENVIGAGYRLAKGAPAGKAKAIEEFAEKHDLPIMTTDVLQPKTFVGKSAQAAAEKIPLAGTGGSRRAQQKARTELVEDYAKSFGEYHPEDVVSSLKRQTSKIKRAAGNSRQVIMDQLDKAKVTSTNAIDAIDAEIERLGKSPSGAERTTADTATIDKLKAYKNDLMSDSSFENIVDLRTQFRTHVKGERMVMPSQSNAAVNRIYSAMSKDMEDTVKSNLGGQALGKWKKSNAVYANEANKIKNTRLKAALQKGDLTPEVINNMLYSNKPSEVKTLFKSLDTKGKTSARAGIIAKAIEKSKGSPDSFLNELNRMSAQTGIAFKGNDREYLKGLKSYLDATRRAGKAGVLTPTGQELFQIAAPTAVTADLFGSGGVGTASTVAYGLLAKAYESKPIRVAMLKLKGMPKGSTKFETQLRKISQMLSTTAQAIRSQDK